MSDDNSICRTCPIRPRLSISMHFIRQTNQYCSSSGIMHDHGDDEPGNSFSLTNPMLYDRYIPQCHHQNLLARLEHLDPLKLPIAAVARVVRNRHHSVNRTRSLHEFTKNTPHNFFGVPCRYIRFEMTSSSHVVRLRAACRGFLGVFEFGTIHLAC